MNIYIGNLPYTTNEDEVRNLFEEFGEVYSVKLITDRETGRLKGFGFVEMEQNGGQTAMEELNEQDFGGRNIVVNEARQKRDNRGGGGGGGGRNRRRF